MNIINRSSAPKQKLVEISEWATTLFVCPPSSHTIRRWCRDGRIPGAVRIGRSWYVPVGAQVMPHRQTAAGFRPLTAGKEDEQ